MINSPEAWESLYEAGGFPQMFSRAAEEAAAAIRAGMPRADELLADSAWACVRDGLIAREKGIFDGLFPRVLAEHMGVGEFTEKVIFSDRVTPGLLDAAKELSEWIGSGGWDQVLQQYPLAAKIESTVRANYIASQVEFLERYEQSRPEITKRFFLGKEAGKILFYLRTETALKQHGRTVIGLQCEGGRCYYKPRDCSVDRFYRHFVEHYFPDITCAPDVIEGDGFGFCSELAAAPVGSRADVHRYFHHYGALTAMYLGLNGGDLHGKNLIACGVYPSVIDLEDLFTPKIRTKRSPYKTEAEKAEGRSLSTMAVLPNRDFQSHRLESSLHLCDDSRPANLPVWKGKTYDITGCEQDFFRGFREGYERISSLRDQVTADLEKERGMTLRSLYNSPELHGMMMNRILAPDFLASEEKARRELDRLRISYETTGKAVVPAILEYEKRCLLEGDLPYYCADLFGTALYGNDTGELLQENIFEESPFSRVKEKLYSLCDAERQMEERLIRQGFEHALRDDEKEGPPEYFPGGDVSGETIRNELREILDKLIQDGIPAPDGTVFWKSNALFYHGRKRLPQYTLQADALNLCGRTAAMDGRGTGGKAEELAQKCLEGISGKISLWKSGGVFPFDAGINCGMGSLLNGLAAAERAGIAGSGGLLDDLIELLSTHPAADGKNVTLAEGSAGLLAALCGIPKRGNAAGETMRIRLITRISDGIAERLGDDALLQRLRENNDPFSGLCGVGAALSLADKTAGTTGKDRLVREIFMGACERFSEDICGWYSNEKKRLYHRGPYAAGIGLCAAQALNASAGGAESVRECLELSFRSVMDEANERILYRQDVLLHGNALRVIFLDRCERLLPGRGGAEKAREILAAMIRRKQETGDYIVFPPGLRNSFDPALVPGTVGIGAVLAALG